ncbi:hypothetical protein LCGC14_1062350 [marine sediment metagenome]|uniref:Uncharacterized protein n=1 Tax=marine sediment metagenome TaxID=412755 RepID=A0A0F9MKR4_9ZZZZ
MIGKIQSLNEHMFKNEWYLTMGLFETVAILNGTVFYFVQNFPHPGTFSERYLDRQIERYKNWI